MSDVKWIKITTSMFDDEKINFVESMPEADGLLVIWIKILTLAGRCNSNGYIFLTENIPYNAEMLSHKFNRPVSVVKLALETFSRLGMIEWDGDFMKISNWEKHQNVQGLDKIREQTKKRVQKYREKQNSLPSESPGCNVTERYSVTQGNATEEELDIEKDIDISSTSTTCHSNKLEPVMSAWNDLGLQRLKSINPNTQRHKLLKARIKEHGIDEVLSAIKSINDSSFLKGQNNKGWTITFDWLVKPNNFIKVLEGNYLDRGIENGKHGRSNKADPYEGIGFHIDDL